MGVQEEVLAGDKYLENISIEFVFKVIKLDDITKDVCVSIEERCLKSNPWDNLVFREGKDKKSIKESRKDQPVMQDKKLKMVV